MKDPNYVYLTSKADRDRRVRRRKRLAEQKVCMTTASHGPATHGRLCYRCRLIHRGVKPDEATRIASQESVDVAA